MEQTKKCFKCRFILPVVDFYKHSKMADGHVNKCKDCYKKDVKNNYLLNVKKPGYIENERKRGRRKYHRLYVGMSKANIYRNIRWQNKYPEKIIATQNCGNIKKTFKDAEKHHWSYNKEHWKDVIFITKKHHMKSHRFLIYDQERMMYRRYDNNVLLDTKELHELFINDCIVNIED